MAEFQKLYDDFMGNVEWFNKIRLDDIKKGDLLIVSTGLDAVLVLRCDEIDDKCFMFSTYNPLQAQGWMDSDEPVLRDVLIHKHCAATFVSNNQLYKLDPEQKRLHTKEKNET